MGLRPLVPSSEGDTEEFVVYPEGLAWLHDNGVRPRFDHVLGNQADIERVVVLVAKFVECETVLSADRFNVPFVALVGKKDAGKSYGSTEAYRGGGR